mmetsp:Transcript_30932/g.72530  ORF Transcript_30932/g.72530 Transcript_30932/m.72530 type:complete len:863 (+) Transcript_30932:37-2625(+)
MIYDKAKSVSRAGTLSLTSPLGRPARGARAARKTTGGGDSVGLRAVQEQRKQEDETRGYSTGSDDNVECCSKCSCFETMTLRAINFNDLANSKFPGKQWNEVPIADQVELLRDALKARIYVIDPHSTYMRLWDFILVFCLVYTALVTPYEIAFIPDRDSILLVINRIVDIVFIKDMIMQFFMKVERNTRQGKIWVRDRRKVALLYVKTWFLIDLASVLPYDDFTDLLQESADGIQSVKILRTIRVLRLVKLLRILKASRMVKRWENRIALKSTSLYLIKFAVLIILSCHWMACVWGFLGLLEGSMLKCKEELLRDGDPDGLMAANPDAYYFFEERTGDAYNPSQWFGDSWVVRWAAGRAANSPTNPCDTGNVYIAALYWSVMTMTSVGYGDVLPYTPAEYLVCTSCMMISSIVWAYIIGAACAVMSKMDPELSEFERRIDDFNAMAHDQDLPGHIRWRGREFIREQRFHMHYLRNIDAWEGLGADLRGTVARQMASHYINHIWFFKGTKAQFREDCAKNFVPMFYERREVIEKPQQLNVVERGAVGRLGRILVPWGYWGEDMLIRMAMLRQDSSAMALTYTEIMSLSRDSLSHVLLDFPEEQMRFRKAATLMALFAVAKIYRVELSADAEERDPHNRWIHDVFETARKVGLEELTPMKGEQIMHNLRLSEAWTERMLEEEQSPGALGELALTSEQKIDYMVKEIYSNVQTATGARGMTRRSSSKDSSAPCKPADSTAVLQRLDRIEQQLERLISSSSHWQGSGVNGDGLDGFGRPAISEGWKPNATAAEAEPRIPGPPEHPLRMPRGDTGKLLPECCTITGSGVPQRVQKRPTPLRSRSKSPGRVDGAQMAQGASASLVSRV